MKEAVCGGKSDSTSDSQASEKEKGRRFHHGWVILAVGTLVVFGSLGLARFGFSVVLPAMQTALDMDNMAAGAMATANLVGYLALSAIGGALAARFGPRAVITCGLAVAGVTMLLTGAAGDYITATLWRAITGLGSGASNVPVIGLLAAWFAPKRRGMAAGVVVTGSSLGLIFAGPVAPRIILAYPELGWRLCWYLFGGMTLVFALGGWLFLRNRPSELGFSPMGPGTGFQQTGAGANQLRWKEVYRSRATWHLGLVYVAFGFSYIIYMTFFVKYLLAEGGYNGKEAGDLFMTMGWCSVLCGLIWGSLSDVIGRRWALVGVYLFHTAAFALFALWPDPVGFTISAVLFGLSAWSIPAIMAATCGDVFGPRMAPAALGFITLMFGIGQAFGPSVAGAMADASGSFSAAFLLASCVAFFGAAGAWLLGPDSTEARDFND